MALSEELSREAIDLLRSLRTRIENRVLAKASTLKPQVVSIGQKFIDMVGLLEKIFEAAAKKAGNLDAHESLITGGMLVISTYNDRLVISRLKPSIVSVSYSRKEGKVVVRTKLHRMEITAGNIVLHKSSSSLELDPADPDDISGKVSDIKRILKGLPYSLELLLFKLSMD